MLDLLAAVALPSQSSEVQLMEAYYLVGMKYLAEGKNDKAVEYLRKARRDTAAFFWPQGYWSEAIAGELERNMPRPLGHGDQTNGS